MTRATTGARSEAGRGREHPRTAALHFPHRESFEALVHPRDSLAFEVMAFRCARIDRVVAVSWDARPTAESWNAVKVAVAKLREEITSGLPIALCVLGENSVPPERDLRDAMVADVSVFDGMECAIWIVQGDNRLVQDERATVLAEMTASTHMPTRVVFRDSFASLIERPVPDLDVDWLPVRDALAEAGWSIR